MATVICRSPVKEWLLFKNMPMFIEYCSCLLRDHVGIVSTV